MVCDVLSFYFDVISHNAYLAWTQMESLCNRLGLALEPVPVVFGALLKANGQLGPAEIPAKREWMLKDVIRKALRLQVPLAPPASHPFNPLTALRACCVDLPDADRRRLIDGLFRAAWAESRDVSDPEVVAAVADACGLDGAAIVTAATSDQARSRLRRHTEHAIAADVFGVPTMVVRGELFWGFDDLDDLERFVSGDDPLARVDLGPWLLVPSSIERPEAAVVRQAREQRLNRR